jgi:hypothetical protein
MNEDKLKEMWSQRTWPPFAGYEEWAELTKSAYDVLVKAAQSEQLIKYGEIGSKIGLYSPEYFEVKIGSVVGAWCPSGTCAKLDSPMPGGASDRNGLGA